jgi:2-polyprenyl-3-methyl-5-hydroxy-6-metoxy-1,4-benzoquinol methylase
MENQKVCPAWLGYALLLPIRKLQHNPQKILAPYVKPGMTVMDYGCAMGYFSIPMAQMVGKTGRVYCVDIQHKMLETLIKRAKSAGVGHILKSRLFGTTYNPNEFQNKLDFALIFAVVHEVTDPQQLFNDLYKMLKSGGCVLFAEPKGHVKDDQFEESLQMAEASGFYVSSEKPMEKGLNALLIKR